MAISAPYTDSTPMPFGKYVGKPLANIPAHYLMYLYNNGLKPGPLRTYIVENMDALQAEISRANKARR